MKYLLLYLAIINAVSFLFMLADKIKAKKHRWRIPERVLLGLSLVGGSVGGLLGLYVLRHKTKHPRFAIGIPLMFVVHVAMLYFLRNYL